MNISTRKIHVLRIGHRLVRDDRTTTHICLVARAFGAEKIHVFNGEQDLLTTIEDVNKRWGGEFKVDIVDDWQKVLKEWKQNGGIVAHLTMYGLRISEVLDELHSADKDVLVVIGAEKVPREIYMKSDFNIAIGNQPHSEVAALSIFLDRFFGGEELKREYNRAKYRILPNAKGKSVEKIL